MRPIVHEACNLDDVVSLSDGDLMKMHCPFDRHCHALALMIFISVLSYIVSALFRRGPLFQRALTNGLRHPRSVFLWL